MSETYKPMTVHEFHSHVQRLFDVGLIDERIRDYRLNQYHTYVNSQGMIYVHISEINELKINEDSNKST
tara:strand:- start:618 stop:824 length:207 start_codon:yes stop_codon:yes gene_type:complete